MKKILKLILCILIPEAVGGLSGYLTFNSIQNWYATLHKPVFNPPNFIFGPVWTLLYLLMGVSLYLVLNQPASEKRKMALGVLGLQLLLNFCWSIIFFTLQRPDWALVEITLLWLCIVWMITMMRPIKPLAAYLQIPYLLWVSFASALNFGIWLLN
jgi:translocator protein